MMRFPGERQHVIDGLSERGIGSLIYYPVPVHRQAYLQQYVPGAADARPAGHRPALRRGAVDPGAADLSTPDELETVVGGDPRASRRRRAGTMTARRSRSASPASVRWAATTCAHLSIREAPRWLRSPTPIRTSLEAAAAQTGAHGYGGRAAAMIDEADTRRRSSIAGPDDAPCATRPGSHRARPARSGREAAGRHRRRGRWRSSAAARARGVPLQVGHVERFNPAVLELGRPARATAGWRRSTRSRAGGRALPGAHPRRRRHRRSRHP